MFCEKCGAKLRKNNIFCPRCGQKHIQNIQQNKRVRKMYGCIVAMGAVISILSLLFNLVYYVAKKEQVYEILKMYHNLSSGKVDTFALIGILIGIVLMIWGIIGEQKEIYKKNNILT